MNVLVGAIAAGSLLLLVATFGRPPDPVALGVLAIVLLALEMETFGLKVGSDQIHFGGTANVSVGATFLLGYPAVAITALAVVAGCLWRRNYDLRKVVFNFGMIVLAFSATYATYRALRGVWGGSPGGFVLACAVAGLVGWAINYGLLTVIISLDSGTNTFRDRAFVMSASRVAPYHAVYGLTGAGVVAAQGAIGSIAALMTFIGPLSIVQFVMGRWVREQQAHGRTIADGFNATLVSLSKAIDLRDHDTEGHCRRVVEYTRMVASRMGIGGPELTALCHGALLHDIGKIGVPDAILHKPGSLTDEEWAVIRQHPELGAQMVADVRQLEHARQIILTHHERFDGRGYPQGLRGDDIPLGARIFAIADSFDAMMSDRPYRSSMTLDEARRELRRCAGTDFDPDCVEAFLGYSDAQLVSVINMREQADIGLLSALPILAQ
ncbi:MAG TPA: HD domain-containing phosphohydrolase [Candidatus Micrarchaeia archaeon]|nr:HD domain-containing phosphohydrolase [Candidatus Micrarchaeia archaeon]